MEKVHLGHQERSDHVEITPSATLAAECAVKEEFVEVEIDLDRAEPPVDEIKSDPVLRGGHLEPARVRHAPKLDRPLFTAPMGWIVLPMLKRAAWKWSACQTVFDVVKCSLDFRHRTAPFAAHAPWTSALLHNSK